MQTNLHLLCFFWLSGREYSFEYFDLSEFIPIVFMRHRVRDYGNHISYITRHQL